MSIVLKDVGYVYSIGSSDEKTALHDINLDIKENELIGIVGRCATLIYLNKKLHNFI